MYESKSMYTSLVVTYISCEIWHIQTTHTYTNKCMLVQSVSISVYMLGFFLKKSLHE